MIRTVIKTQIMQFGLILYMRLIVTILTVFMLPASDVYGSGAFPLDDLSGTLIGINKSHRIAEKETLLDLAIDYGIGYNEIIAANSRIDPWVPDEGAEIVIPTRWLLPEVMDNGVLINLAELRLYHFFMINGRRYVKTFPVGIGRQGLQTPTGSFKITLKVKDPVWSIPLSIRKEDPTLPAFVPPGPDNPLGRYWLELSDGYGIHGTNRPYGIGRRVSHGCIRLYPGDIEILFKYVKKGTEVRIIDEPVKTALYNNKVFIEVHSSGMDESELIAVAIKKLSRKSLLKNINTFLLIKAVKSSTGLPAVISE